MIINIGDVFESKTERGLELFISESYVNTEKESWKFTCSYYDEDGLAFIHTSAVIRVFKIKDHPDLYI